MQQATEFREMRHFHLCAGLGGGAKGFNRGSARVGRLEAKLRCIGGVDVDPAGVADFTVAAGVPGTLLDLFDEEQYRTFHGKAPPAGWRPALPIDIRRAAGFENPNMVFVSAPCKGFSGLLSGAKSESPKYQALNGLTLRCIWLTMEAFGDDPPELLIFENVPRIASRGRSLLDRIVSLLRHYGYAVAETSHNCGEIGGLAQSRQRFLLVARHMKKVPPFLYEPKKQRMRSVGEILKDIPTPGDTSVVGPMHRLASLQWQTWTRLAFVEAGSDWRSLNRLRVQDGVLSDYGIAPVGEWRAGVLGVNAWTDTACTVAGRNTPTNGAYSVADPRPGYPAGTHNNIFRVVQNGSASPTVTGAVHSAGGALAVADPIPGYRDAFKNVCRVVDTSEAAPTITAAGRPSNGGLAVADHLDRTAAALPVADPRHGGPAKFNNVYRVVRADDASPAVTGGTGPTAGGLAVADPKPADGSYTSKYRVTKTDEHAGTVISASTTGQGAFAVADIRYPWGEGTHTNKMAVLAYDEPCKTVTGSDRVGSGALSVADRRPLVQAPASALESLPAPTDRLVAVIIAEDGTWHRPFTTYELAALQSLVIPGERLDLVGDSDAAHRERIGNAVPPDAATAIASAMAKTLLLAWSGESFMLSEEPIWVQPLAIALSVRTEDNFALDADAEPMGSAA